MKLQVIRAMKGKNQHDLRIATGLSQSKISLIERGYVIPNEIEKAAIAGALEVAVDEIEWPKTEAQG